MIRIVVVLIMSVLAAGCASTKITKREQFVTGSLPKPMLVWVKDFTATPAGARQTPEQIAAGRRLGTEIAEQIVHEINGMGLSAKRCTSDAVPPPNDILIQGYLFRINEGNKAERVAIGFGAGSSRLCTAVEGFQVTPNGLRPLERGNIEARGGKKPGGALAAAGLIATANPAGLIVSGVIHLYHEVSGRSALEGRARQTAREIGDLLKRRFEQQGWI